MWYGTDAPPPGGPEALSVAPMLDCTDRHFRYLARLLSRRTVLYSEMMWDSQIAKAAAEGRDALDEMLGFSPEEHPVVAQLGGCTPELMECAAALCKLEYGYDHVNLNAGCPAKSGPSFGAALMKDPALIGRLCKAIGRGARAPATLKCRIGVDEHDSPADLAAVMDAAMRASVETVVVHARKAILGLDPRQNRSVPPLRYEVAHGLVEAYPHLRVTLNGGIKSLGAAREQIAVWNVHGVMIGRQAYAEPWLLADADRVMFGAPNRATSRAEVLAEYAVYADEAVERAAPGRPRANALRLTLRPVLGLFTSTRCSKAWRAGLQSEQSAAKGREAELLPSEVLQAAIIALRSTPDGTRALELRPPDDDRGAAEKRKRNLAEH
jgi:tRNA-dihydrouridine synthase A